MSTEEKLASAKAWLEENPAPNPPVIGALCDQWPHVEAHDYTTARHGDSRNPQQDWERAPQTFSDWQREAMGV